jgi:hypothetical protein
MTQALYAHMNNKTIKKKNMTKKIKSCYEYSCTSFGGHMFSLLLGGFFE